MSGSLQMLHPSYPPTPVDPINVSTPTSPSTASIPPIPQPPPPTWPDLSYEAALAKYRELLAEYNEVRTSIIDTFNKIADLKSDKDLLLFQLQFAQNPQQEARIKAEIDEVNSKITAANTKLLELNHRLSSLLEQMRIIKSLFPEKESEFRRIGTAWTLPPEVKSYLNALLKTVV